MDWTGKIIYTFGDSITWYDGKPYSEAHTEKGGIARGYQSHMREQLGAQVVNCGANGQTLPGILSVIEAQKYDGVHAVTITGGVNDWGQHVLLGTVEPIGSAFDRSTSLGALQSAIEYIMKQNQSTRIYLLTPIRAKFKETSSDSLAGMEFPPDYADGFIDLGKLYGLTVCDWYRLSGFNETSYPEWYCDIGPMLGDRYVHVGDKGYKRMADILISVLKA